MLQQTKRALKDEIAGGDFAAVFQQLEDFLTSHNSLLLDDLLLLRRRYEQLMTDQAQGVISYADAQETKSRISRDLFYFIDQVPGSDATPQRMISGRRSGKVLHDIPGELPLKKLTKCVVRIAETEELVRQDYQGSTAAEVDDIPIARNMSVELFELGDEGHFEIKTVNSAAQSVDAFETTQWTFYVRPLTEGSHLLFLRITILQLVNGKELAKETVLEKLVDVTTETPAADLASNRQWQATEVVVANPDNHITAQHIEPDRGIGPPPNSTVFSGPAEVNAPVLPSAAAPKQVNDSSSTAKKGFSWIMKITPLLIIGGGLLWLFALGPFMSLDVDPGMSIDGEITGRDAVSPGQPVTITIEAADFDPARLRFQLSDPETKQAMGSLMVNHSDSGSLELILLPVGERFDLKIEDLESETSYFQNWSSRKNAVIQLRKVEE